MLGALISSQLASLHELDTVYGIEDAYTLLDVMVVDAHNRRQVALDAERER